MKSTIVAAFAALGVIAFFGTAPAYAEEGTPTDATTKPTETIVTVKAGDTLDAIAREHNLTYVQLFNANADIANPDMIDVGQQIRIPASDEQLPDRFSAIIAAAQAVVSEKQQAAPAAPSTQSRQAPANSGSSRSAAPSGSTAGNTYAWGNCTWYVKNRRPDLPNMLGNGGQWVGNAAARGYATGSTPRAGAVAEIPGHVMYVESVNGNGTINISEMNYNGGLGVVNYRTISAASARYIY